MAILLSSQCTTVLPELGLELPAGVPVEVTDEQAAAALATPTVIRLPEPIRPPKKVKE